MRKPRFYLYTIMFLIVFALHEGYGAASVYRPFLKANFNVHMVAYRYQDETVFAHIGNKQSGAYQLLMHGEYLYPSNEPEYGDKQLGTYPANGQFMKVNELSHEFDLTRLQLNTSKQSWCDRLILNDEEFNLVMMNLKEYTGVVYYCGLLPITYGKVVTPEKRIGFKTIWLIDFTIDPQNPIITQIK